MSGSLQHTEALDIVEKTYIKTWAREFSGMCKNPAGYKKLVDGTWDFDTAMDITLREIAPANPVVRPARSDA